MSFKQSEAFALIIDEEAYIKKIIGQDDDIKLFDKGENLVNYIEPSSLERFMEFLKDTNEDDYSFGGEIIFTFKNKIIRTTLSMMRYDKDIICMSLNESESTMHVLNEVIRINNQQTNMLRKAKGLSQQVKDDTNTAFLEEVTKLNSDLINTQRKLERRNIELTELNKKLDQLGHTDYLTNAGNRRKFFKDVQTRTKQCSMLLIMIDFNNFKIINDTFGHSIGDEVLVKFSKLVQKNVTSHEGELYRIGGDEFAVFVPKKTTIDIESLITKINQLLQRYHKSVTVAYGIVTLDQNVKISKKKIEAVLIDVDKRMYKNKSKLKKQVQKELV